MALWLRDRRTLAAVAVLLLAGCGPDRGVATLSEPAGPASEAQDDRSPVEAALEFAECMRDHGVDIDDPSPEALIHFDQEDVADPDLDEAQEACNQFLPPGFSNQPNLSPAEQAQQYDQAVAYTQCMRAQGVDLPDPEPGGPLIGLGPGVNPNDPDFRAAERECGHFLRPLRGSPEP